MEQQSTRLDFSSVVSAGEIRTVPTSRDFSVSIYEHEIPAFVESELDRLYGSCFSSLHYLKIYEDLCDVDTGVISRNGEVLALFLFRRVKQNIFVINQSIRVQCHYIDAISKHLFAVYRQIASVTFHALSVPDGTLSLASYRYGCDIDVILRAPASVADYLASLGKSSMKTIRKQRKRLLQKFPSYSVRQYYRDEVNEEHLRILARFKAERMKAAHKQSLLDDQEVEKVLRMIRECGSVIIATIDDTVCGGQIIYRLGNNQMFRAIAHDSQYDDFSLGTILLLQSICDTLDEGVGEIDLGAGLYDYKFRFGGVARKLEHIVVFRSNAHKLIYAPPALAMQARDGLLRQMARTRRWLLLTAARDGTLASQIARTLLGSVRRLKRLAGH